MTDADNSTFTRSTVSILISHKKLFLLSLTIGAGLTLGALATFGFLHFILEVWKYIVR